MYKCVRLFHQEMDKKYQTQLLKQYEEIPSYEDCPLDRDGYDRSEIMNIEKDNEQSHESDRE